MREEDLSILVNDFSKYLDYVYIHIGLPNSTPLQQRIAYHLGKNPDRLILEAARGTGKSWITSIFATWRLLRNPDEKVLIVSASSPKAIEIATFVRRLFEEVPLLHHLRPGKGQRDSVQSFDVAGAKSSIAPSVAVAGITGQITGKRASLIIADDVEIPTNSMTEEMRAKLMERTKEFEALLIPDMPNSIIFLGTPQSMETIYKKLPYETTILPAQVPEDESVYEGKLDDWIFLQGGPGEATDKVRFPESVLLERKAGMGEATYRLQFLLDTTMSDSERFPLKQKDFTCMPLDKKEGPATVSYTSSKEYNTGIANLGFTGDSLYKPFRISQDYLPYDKIIMAIDPSGSGADETSFVVLGVLSGNLFLLDWGGTRKGYSDEALMFLALKAQEWNVNEIVPEKNFGSGMFAELFRKVLVQVYPCTIIDDFLSRGQKEVRIIDNIAPVLTNHQLIINEDKAREEVEWVQELPVERLEYSLLYQLTHITYDRQSLVHDDRLDALAIGCQYLAEYVIVDASKRIQEIKEKEMEDWLYEKVYAKAPTRSTSIIGNLQSARNRGLRRIM